MPTTTKLLVTVALAVTASCNAGKEAAKEPAQGSAAAGKEPASKEAAGSAKQPAGKPADHNLQFNQAEALGVAYLDPIRSLLDAQERHWVAAVARKLGKNDMSALEKVLEDRAAAQFHKLDEMDAAHGSDPLFGVFVPDGPTLIHKRLYDVKADWAKALEVGKHGSAADINAAHTAALATTADFVVNFVANYSNLILDPDLDSYWLMDMAVVKCPTIGVDYATAVSQAMLGLSGDRADWAMGFIGAITDGGLNVGFAETIDLATAIGTTKDYGNNTKIVQLKEPFDELKAASGALSDYLKSKYIKPLVTGRPIKGGPGSPELLAATMKLFDALDAVYMRNNVPLLELIDRRVAMYSPAHP